MHQRADKAIRLYGEGRYEEALSEIDSALNEQLSDDDRHDIASNKVNILMHMGRLDEASTLAKALLANAPSDSIRALNSRHQIASILQLNGKFSEAATEYAAILALEPKFDSRGTDLWFFDFMRLQHGVGLARLKKFDHALQQLEAIREPDEMGYDWVIERHYYLGLCFFELRDFQSASTAFRRVVATGGFSDRARSLYYLVQAERENGRPKAAIEALAELAKMSSPDIPNDYIQTLLADLDPGGQGVV